jgi:phosphodiesterase/alkaline phosphatase D-like protein
MAGPLGALRHIHAHQERQEGRSAATASRSRPARRLGTMGALVVASAAAIAMAMLPVVATPASAQGTWTLTLGTSTGATTTGFVVNGTVTPDGEAGFVEVVYEPTGTPITSSSPTAGCVNNVCAGNLVFGNGVTTPQSVSVAVDQLSPNTSYIYELLATEDDDDRSTDRPTQQPLVERDLRAVLRGCRLRERHERRPGLPGEPGPAGPSQQLVVAFGN